MKKKKRTVEALKWSFTTAVANNHCRFSPFLSFFFQKTSTSQKKKKRKAHERMHLFELMVSDTELHTVSLYIFHKTQKCRSASTLYFGLGLVKEQQQKKKHTHTQKKKRPWDLLLFSRLLLLVFIIMVSFVFFFVALVIITKKKERKTTASSGRRSRRDTQASPMSAHPTYRAIRDLGCGSMPAKHVYV